MTKLLFALLALPLAAQTSDPWKPLEFLIGEWTGEGGGGPGQGSGEFSFRFDLNRHVLVRKNFAEYPGQERHEDLMIVYLDEAFRRLRAIYFDTEGHTIRYAVASSGPALVFESEASEPGPRFRLTYTPAGEQVKGKFEIRAPGEAQYKAYLDFSARRK